LIRRYGVERLISARFLPDRQLAPVASPVVSHEIARAQRIVEGENLDIRRRLWEFSAVIEAQRRHIQEWRQGVLVGDRHGDLLRRRCPDRWRELATLRSRNLLVEIERRLTLLAIDRRWSEHLAELSRIRDGIQVVSFVGKDPATEFCREASDAFSSLAAGIEDDVVASFESLEVGDHGIDWRAQGLVGPSATWTYLVSDAPFGNNPMRGLANRAGFASLGAAAAAPVLFLWGLILHWQRRRRRADIDATKGSG
jgi:preprotein translocase subunit SecA